jgi:hypothetical protein
VGASKKKRSRQKRAWEGDPFVPISPPWLRAVMQEHGVSTAELWRRVGGNEQTLAHHTKGHALKQTRRSRRAQIAKALGVAEQLLAGEALYLPKGAQLGYEAQYSARTWLAAQRLITKCDIAARQDIEDRSPGAAWEGGEADEVRFAVEACVNGLMQVGEWRARLLRWTTNRPPRQGYVEPLPVNSSSAVPVVDPAHEAGILALIQALEHVLTPWFDRQAVLDYAALRELAAEFQRSHTTDRETPSAILTGLGITSTRVE